MAFTPKGVHEDIVRTLRFFYLHPLSVPGSDRDRVMERILEDSGQELVCRYYHIIYLV